MDKTENILIFTLFIVFSIFIQTIIYFKRNDISNYLKINDYPDKIRKFHKHKTPLVGSLSLFLIFIFTLLFNIKLNILDRDFNVILFTSILMFLLGFLDDRLNLKPHIKIFCSLLILLFSISISENLIINKFYTKTYDTFFYLKSFNIFFTILCLIILINALNLTDGINGLAVGIVIFWLLHIILFFNLNFNFNYVTIFIIFNLVIIFINIYKGKYFLGDSGTLLLSTFVGLLFIKNMNEYIQNSYVVISIEEIFIIFMLPGIDMLRLFISRLIKKKNPFAADNNHFHHIIIRKFSLQYSLIIYFLFINTPIILSLYLKLNTIYIIFFFIILYLFTIFFFFCKKANNSNL